MTGIDWVHQQVQEKLAGNSIEITRVQVSAHELIRKILTEIDLAEQDIKSMSIFKKIERLEDMKDNIKELCQEEANTQ